MPNSNLPLCDTGERMVPESADWGTLLDHVRRYRFAIPYVPGKRVLDIACGEGYGAAAMLAAGAAQVIGMDISSEAVEHARNKYGVDARVGAAEAINLPDHSVDVVVSFETIEHLRNPAIFLSEASRVLTIGGLIVISTPNKDHAQAACIQNHFHESEMTFSEFRDSMETRFTDARYFSQQLVHASLFSKHAFAAVHTSPKCRIFSGPLFRLRRFICSENTQLPDATFRQDPVRAVTRHQTTTFDRLFDPGQIRPYDERSRDQPVYFLAVASNPRKPNKASA